MQKKGFSLLELMIVIVIIGVLYTLTLSKLQSPQQEMQKPSLTTLKSYLSHFSHDHKKVELLCQKSCDKCVVLSDGVKLQELKGFFDADVEFYRYDFFLGEIALNRESCFDFSVDGDGVSDQVIIVYKEKVYDYTNYFTPVDEYDSLQELRDAKEKLISEVE